MIVLTIINYHEPFDQGITGTVISVVIGCNGKSGVPPKAVVRLKRKLRLMHAPFAFQSAEL